MKAALLILIIFHGVIHMLGFTKAFNVAAVNQLTQPITRSQGVLWLLSAILFVACAIFLFFKKDSWWVLAAMATVVSQYLIVASWHDAKFGTIANVIILGALIIGYGTWRFARSYESEVTKGLTQTTFHPDELLTEVDIQHLPEPVKKYIRYTGALGKPKVKNFKAELSGQIRKNEQSPWMPFTTEQYNFLDASSRLFFMKATMKHLPVAGFHSFKNGNAFMDIRLFSLFKVQYLSGKEMGIAETVTFFNDMCCMAPATLIDPRIKWVHVSRNEVKAEFTNNDVTIAASLYFNEKGELINFVSPDRYAASENGTLIRTPWSTPLREYKVINGHTLANYANTIYHYPSGDLCYGNFRLTNIEYNSKSYK